MSFGFYDTLHIELIKAGLTALITTSSLAATWFIGQRLIEKSNLRQKRKELDIATSNQFYQLYGEYIAVWRLWKIITGRHSERADVKVWKETWPDKEIPDVIRWKLLERASIAEGSVEAVLLKLSTERSLSDKDKRTLGLFRQAFSQLRQHIRDNTPMDWNYDSPEYMLVKNLASDVAFMLPVENHRKSAPLGDRWADFRDITNIREGEWAIESLNLKKKLEATKSTSGGT